MGMGGLVWSKEKKKSRLDGHYIDELPVSSGIEGHLSFDLGEERVISSHSHIFARVVLCSPLAYDDVSGLHHTAAGLFYAKTLRGAVSPVSRASHSFFMGKQL
jgi:hypothetical protein